MQYVRGSSDDWDRYARVTGDQGWSWNSMQRDFFKVLRPKLLLFLFSIRSQNERWTPPVDGHNTSGQFDPAVHGFHGMTSVSVQNFPTPIDDKVLVAARQLGTNWPFNLDFNSGHHLGIGGRYEVHFDMQSNYPCKAGCPVQSKTVVVIAPQRLTLKGDLLRGTISTFF